MYDSVNRRQLCECIHLQTSTMYPNLKQSLPHCLLQGLCCFVTCCEFFHCADPHSSCVQSPTFAFDSRGRVILPCETKAVVDVCTKALCKARLQNKRIESFSFIC